MAVKNPQFEINIRKNTNANNPGYGKYYPKAVEKQTISLRGPEGSREGDDLAARPVQPHGRAQLDLRPRLRRSLSLGSGPDEKVARDFTSVPDPSARRLRREVGSDYFPFLRMSARSSAISR